METLIITLKLKIKDGIKTSKESMLRVGQIWVEDQLEKIKYSPIYEVESSTVEVKDE